LIQAELAYRGVRLTDDEVRAAAARALDEDPVDGSEGLAAFGDPRALPELSRALDAFQHLDCVVCDYLAMLAFARGIEALGGVLSPSQTAKLEEYRERQAGAWIKGPDFDAPRSARVDERRPDEPRADAPACDANGAPQPKDPCHCGSGRKYKKCHLDERTPASVPSRWRRGVEVGSEHRGGGGAPPPVPLRRDRERPAGPARCPARSVLQGTV
jgi:hypothetical protein